MVSEKTETIFHFSKKSLDSRTFVLYNNKLVNYVFAVQLHIN